jgi:hypothetical protein
LNARENVDCIQRLGTGTGASFFERALNRVLPGCDTLWCGFLGGHYDLEDGGIIFLRNVGIHVQYHDPERSPSDLRSEDGRRCEPSGCM